MTRVLAIGLAVALLIACSARHDSKLHLRNVVCDPDACCTEEDDPDDGCCDPTCSGGGGDDDDSGGGGGGGNGPVTCWTNARWCLRTCAPGQSGCSVGHPNCVSQDICYAPTQDQCLALCGPAVDECDAQRPCPDSPPDPCASCDTDHCQVCNDPPAPKACVPGCPAGRYQWDDAPGGCRCVPTE